MESIVKKLFLTGCLVVGLAVSLTSFATYAADDPKAVTGDTSFKLTVQNALTLSDVSAANITAKPGQVATGDLNATVQSGTKFTLSLSAADPALSGSGSSAGSSIPALGNLNSASANTNGWGIKKQNDTDYTALTTDAVLFYTHPTAADDAVTIPLEVGVRTANTLPAGNYTTTVTVTAATAN